MFSIKDDHMLTLRKYRGMILTDFFQDLTLSNSKKSPEISLENKKVVHDKSQYAVQTLYEFGVRGYKKDAEIQSQLAKFFELPNGQGGLYKVQDVHLTWIFRSTLKLKRYRSYLIYMGENGWTRLDKGTFKSFSIAFISLFLKSNIPSFPMLEQVYNELQEDKEIPVARETNEYMQFNDCMYDIKTGGKVPFSHEIVPRISYDLSMAEVSVSKSPPSRFKQFIQQIVNQDEEYEQFMYKLLAQLISPLNSGQYNGAFLYGSGANGKSILLDLIRNFYKKSDISTKNLSALNSRFGLSDLDKKHIIISHESSKVSANSNAMSALKNILTDRFVHIEEKGKDGRDADVELKVVMATNEKLHFDRESQAAMKRRIVILPFKYVVPEEERNPDLLRELLEEKAEIMSFFLHLMTESVNNVQKLQFPSVVQETCDEWFSATQGVVTKKPDQEFLVTKWIERNLFFKKEDARLTCKVLRDKIKNEVAEDVSSQTINRIMQEKFAASVQQSNGERFWKGVTYRNNKVVNPFHKFMQ